MGKLEKQVIIDIFNNPEYQKPEVIERTREYIKQTVGQIWPIAAVYECIKSLGLSFRNRGSKLQYRAAFTDGTEITLHRDSVERTKVIAEITQSESGNQYSNEEPEPDWADPFIDAAVPDYRGMEYSEIVEPVLTGNDY